MAITAWKSPGTLTNVDRDSKTPSWSNPGNAAADDGSYADVQASIYDDYTDWLEALDFGFTTSDIPSGSTIDGIEVRINRKASIDGIQYVRDSSLRLVISTGLDGDDKADTGTNWATSDEDVTRGGAADDWNWSGDDDDARSSATGVRLSAHIKAALTARIGYIDHIEMRYHYTAPSGDIVPYRRRIENH